MSPLLVVSPFVFVFIWSTGWIAAGYAARDAEPIFFLFMRFALAAAVMGLIIAISRVPLRADQATIRNNVIVGVMIHAIYLGTVWWAVKQGVPAGISGILAGVQPVLTAVLAPALLGERLTPLQAVGVMLGFFGLVLVLWPKLVIVDGAASAHLAFPLALNVLGMVAVTLGTFYQKRYGGAADLRVSAFWQYVGAALVMLPIVPLLGGFTANWSTSLVLTMTWSVLVLSIGGVGIFLYLIKRGAVSKATAYIYLVPPMSALLAFIAFGETLTMVQIMGMAVTAAGVWFATRGPDKAAT